jgi:hypothetical protein
MQPSHPASALPSLENILERSPPVIAPETSALAVIARMS